MNKTYITKVYIEKSYYMEWDKKNEEVFHTVTASSEEECKEKIRNFYKIKSDPYSIYYSVDSIEIFEHIE